MLAMAPQKKNYHQGQNDRMVKIRKEEKILPWPEQKRSQARTEVRYLLRKIIHNLTCYDPPLITFKDETGKNKRETQEE
jgi:hypothetical protein